MTALIIGLALIVLVLAVVIASQRSEPRVTQIDRTIRRENDGEEKE